MGTKVRRQMKAVFSIHGAAVAEVQLPEMVGDVFPLTITDIERIK